MNVLINTGHPAQVHNFRNLKFELEKRSHHVYWLATNKDISLYLLDYYDIKYGLLRKPGKSIFSKGLCLFQNTISTIRYIKKNKIDFAFSRISPHVSLACYVLGIRHVGLTDTESAGFYDKLFCRFLSVLFTGKSFKKQLRRDQIRFDSNLELFYLHPGRFKPLRWNMVAAQLNLSTGESYVIMRFVSWDAYHDNGLSGYTDAGKIQAVKEFSKYSKVFISSERELQPELEPYRIKIPPERMHDVLAHATLFFGESATMASESAVLGTPAVLMDKNGRGYTDEEQRYGLVFHYKNLLEDQEASIRKGLMLLTDPYTLSLMKARQQQFIKYKIDLTNFMVWFMENYPKSLTILQNNPDYQYNFK